jgi:hypothetical protein
MSVQVTFFLLFRRAAPRALSTRRDHSAPPVRPAGRPGQLNRMGMTT